MEKAFKERTKLVRGIITEKPYKIISAKQIITDDEKEAKEFYKKALKDNQEGVMMKNLEDPYKPGRRVGNMIKVKPEERDLDLVITGAEYGCGKRSGWMSSFILSCQNERGEFLEIGKMGTGIKEKEGDNIMTFAELTKILKPHIIKESGKSVTIKPRIVLSVTYQEIQRSPNYKSGFALRFPTFVALRPDKKPTDIATLKEVAEDYNKQKNRWKYG